MACMEKTVNYSPLSVWPQPDIDNIPMAIVGIDQSSTVSLVNRFAEKLAGSRKRFLGKPVETLSHVFPFLPDVMRRTLEKGCQVQHIEDIPPYCWLVTSSPHPKQRGKALGALATVQNIAFYHSWFKQRLNQEKIGILGRLTEQTAHEIRNPLTTIKGFLQMYHSCPDSLPWALLYQEIEAIEASVEQLLSLSARCSGPKQEFDLNQLVCDTWSTLEQRSTEQKVWTVLSLPLELGKIVGERDKIRTVILHLCHNALDAMPAGGVLSITTEKKGRQVTLTVADTGCGISQANMERIFEPFFSTYPDKAGLGLTVCQQILLACRGTISIKSKEGLGTVVTVTLPQS